MKIQKLLGAILLLLALSAWNGFGQTLLKTENFDSEDSAKTNGWVELGSRENGMDYGYSPGTGYAGGSDGSEAGGRIGRNQIRSMYADVFGSLLTLDTPLTATGRLAIAYQNGNAAVVIGHSDSTRIGLNQDSLATIGIRTVPSQESLEAVIGLTKNVRTLTVLDNMDVSGATSYLWSYSWDPSGGDTGNGALTVTVQDSIGGVSTFTNTVTLSLSESDRNQNPQFDSFGLTTRTLSASEVFSQTYVDEVEYTALPACARISATSALVVPGQSNKAVMVSIPAAANLSSDVHVTITSPSPAIAEPLGAVGGSLTLTFPTGGASTETFYINGVSPGNVTFNLASPDSLCLVSDQIAVTVASPAMTVEKNETFDTADSAHTNGWGEIGSRDNGQDFGFSDTATAGGPAGEAGGFVKRDPIRAAYADIFSGQMSLNDFLQASGTIVITTNSGANAGPIIGFVDSSKIGLNTEANQIGLQCVIASGACHYYARVTLADNTGYEVPVLTPAVESQVYYWDFTYDPTGGPSGDGALTVNITDGISAVTNTTVINLSAGDREVGASFDSFGMYSRSLSANAAGAPAFMDNLSYTAVPGGACVRFLGDTSLAAVAGQTNKFITITIPAAASAGGDFDVTIQSLDPAVAVLSGADETGTLILTFPAGSELTQEVPYYALSPGDTTFMLSHGGSFCTGEAASVSVLPFTATRSKTESFDTAESAAANGWVELGSRDNDQDFGFSDTATAGGPAGEAGGFVKRDPIRAAYADIFSGQMSLNDFLQASGTIVITTNSGANAGPIIGFVDSSKIGLNTEANQIGLECAIFSGACHYYARVTLANNTGYEVPVLTPAVEGQVYQWDFTYDPTGGPSGDGALTVNIIDGVSAVTNTTVISLTVADREVGASFDSFGMYSRSLSARTDGAPAFMDNVSYSAPNNSLHIVKVELVGDNLRLTIDTPETEDAHQVLETTALGQAFSPVSGVNFSVVNNQLVAEFPKPDSTRFYQVTIP